MGNLPTLVSASLPEIRSHDLELSAVDHRWPLVAAAEEPPSHFRTRNQPPVPKVPRQWPVLVTSVRLGVAEGCVAPGGRTRL
jgi:hypothetical protein